MTRGAAALVLVGLAVGGCSVDPAALLTEAQARFDAGDIRTASIHVSNVLQAEPDNVRARILRGRIALVIGNLNLARGELERSLALGAEEASIVAPLADTLIELNESGEALSLLDRVPEPARDADYWLRRGEALLRAERPDDASSALTRSAELGEESSRRSLALAQLSSLRGDVAASKELLGRAVELAGTPAEVAAARTARARHHLASQQLEEAAADLREAVAAYAAHSAAGREVALLSTLVQLELALNDLDAAQTFAMRLASLASNATLSSYTSGIVAYRHGDYAEAVRNLQRAVNREPENPLFLTLLGAAHLARGNFGQAEQHLRAAIASSPGDPAPIKLLAETRLRQQRPADALEALRPLANESDDPELDVLRGVASLQAGNAEQAIGFLQQAVAQNAGNDALRLELARIYLATGRDAEALQLLASLSGGDEALNASLMSLFAQLRSGDFEAGRQGAVDLVARFPQEPRAHVAAGMFYQVAGDSAVAESSFRQALRVDDRFVPARLLLAGLISQRDDLPEAERLLDEVLEIEPNNVGALAALAQIASGRGEFAEAEALLLRAVEASPAVPLRLALARIRLRLGNVAGAEEQVDAAAAAAPGDANVTAARGLVALASGRFAEAVRHLREANAAQPTRLDIAVALARAQSEAEDLAGARATLMRAAEAAPGVMPVRYALGSIELRLGDASAALEIAKALQVDFPMQAPGYVLEAEARVAQRRYDAAARSFAAAYAYAPAWEILARHVLALQLAGRAADTEPLLREWLVQRPDHVAGRLALADWLQNAGREQDAIAEYDKVLAAAPDNVGALNNAAWLYRESDAEHALSLARRALELAPRHPAVLDTLGWILIGSGGAEEGLGHLEAAAELAPAAADIQYHFGYALARTGRTEQARELLRSLLEQQGAFATRAEAEALLRSL